jgi:hypothetical protein
MRVTWKQLEALNHAGFIDFVASSALATRARTRDEETEREEEQDQKQSQKPAFAYAVVHYEAGRPAENEEEPW